MIKNSITLVPFPFEDFTSSKVRPALCLTSKIGEFDHVIIAFITSKKPDNILDTDYVIKKGTEEWKETGLLTDSVIRLHKIVSVPKTMLKRKLGKINQNTAQNIDEKLKNMFEINT